MKFVLDPSLEHLALVKIVTSMWNERDVRCLMSEIDFSLTERYRRESWQQIENRVMDRVPSLPLPVFLREKINCLIKPIGIQILDWMRYHNADVYRHVILPADFCWTSHGTIDRKKTAEMLIKDERIGARNRYQLACIYCMECYIPVLRKEITGGDEESFRYTVYNESEFLSFWESKMRYGEHLPGSPQHMFRLSAHCGNKAATEYFFGRLTAAEKRGSLLGTARRVKDPETLCFLLMQMDEPDQRRVFQVHPRLKLECFLNWPFQSLFLEVLKHGLEFIPCISLYILLCDVVDKIKQGYKDWNYADIFRALWQEGRSCCKYHTICECMYGFLLHKLLEIKDRQNIQLIIRDASPEDKRRLINSYPVLYACESLFLEKDWDLLQFLIHACLSSEEDKLNFKKKFEMRYNIKKNLSLNKQKWNELFSLLARLLYSLLINCTFNYSFIVPRI